LFAEVGAAAFATNQVALSSTAASVVAARTGAPGTGRQNVTVINMSASPVYLGAASTITTATGMFIPGVVGANITLPTTAAVWGVASAGATPNVAYAETY
jgi:hypothetical protein